jgi:hypothetical protein
MDTSGKNWKVLLSLLPAGWQQAALECGAVKRLRGFSSFEALLRTLLLHIGLGYSLRETAVRARLADWADVTDVALLKRMRNSAHWLRFLCVALLRESGAIMLEETVGAIANRGWHSYQRAGQNRESVADSLQPPITQFNV